MITGIDHVVLLVPNLETAIADAAATGFTVTTGGSHNEGGTHNALIPFADGTYIELIAFNIDVPARDHYFARRYAQGMGLAELALRTTDIDHDVSVIGERGLQFPIPTQLGRHVPDGRFASWRMSLPAVLHPTAGYPFLIQDLTDRSIRVPETAAATTHANGAVGIAVACLVVDDMLGAAEQLGAILSLPPSRSNEHFPSGRGLRRLPIGESDQWLALLQPLPDTAPMSHLETFGNGLYAIALRTIPGADMLPGDGRLLPVERFSGARIFLQDEAGD